MPHPAASRGGAARLVVARGGSGIGRVERERPRRDRRPRCSTPETIGAFVGIAARYDRAAGYGFAALWPQHAKLFEPPPGPAGDVNGCRKTKAVPGDRRADRLSALSPDRRRRRRNQALSAALSSCLPSPHSTMSARDAVLPLRRLSRYLQRPGDDRGSDHKVSCHCEERSDGAIRSVRGKTVRRLPCVRSQ